MNPKPIMLRIIAKTRRFTNNNGDRKLSINTRNTVAKMRLCEMVVKQNFQHKKKHNALAYHRVREAVAAKVIILGHCTTDQNYADCLTKALGERNCTVSLSHGYSSHNLLIKGSKSTECDSRYVIQ